jgi:hypothetical protein
MKKNKGIMEAIEELLVEGKSSRQVIDMGYRPGSVYGALRQLQLAAFQEMDFEVYHPDPPIPCPGCGQPVGHWTICGICKRLLPSGCKCSKNSKSLIHGYSRDELLGKGEGGD